MAPEFWKPWEVIGGGAQFSGLEQVLRVTGNIVGQTPDPTHWPYI